MNYEYVDSHIEWISQYPKHWKIDRIKDKTINVVGGDWGDDPESDKDGENIVVLRVADLDNICFNYDNLTIRKIKDNSYKSRKITKRCLVIEKSGGGKDYQDLHGGTTTGYYSKKFVHNMSFKNPTTYVTACPIFRYAEILLNAAEALNEAKAHPASDMATANGLQQPLR
jgi:hypothetical protein